MSPKSVCSQLTRVCDTNPDSNEELRFLKWKRIVLMFTFLYFRAFRDVLLNESITLTL